MDTKTKWTDVKTERIGTTNAPQDIAGERNPEAVSVIVPMRNSEATIGDTLDSLLAQTDPHFELIVSDNGSSDRSVAIAEGYRDKFENMRIIDASISPGSGFARRAGVEVAVGDLLIFVDSDDVVSENYVEAMAGALRKTPFVHAAQSMTLLNPPWVAKLQPGRGARTEMLGDWKYAGSATLGMRRATYDEVGGFCTEPEIAEDNDFCFRMRMAGHDLQVVPEAVVQVRQKYTLRAAFDQGRYYGRCHGHTNRLWRPLGLPVESEWTLVGRAARLLLPRRLRALRSREGRLLWVHEFGSVGARTWANVKDVVTQRKFRPATGLIRPSEDPFLAPFRAQRN
jgi:glycosyltransferase involved in cell wall biosynthesis